MAKKDDQIKRMRTAEEIAQDFVPIDIDLAIKKGRSVSTRTLQNAVTQAIKEAKESLSLTVYLSGYKDGYAAALDAVINYSKDLQLTADDL